MIGTGVVEPGGMAETYRDVDRRLRAAGYARHLAKDRFFTPDRPRPGYFKRRLEPRSTTWQPGSIYDEICFDPLTGEVLDRPLYLAAEFLGYPVEVDYVWGMWEIDEEEYDWLVTLNSIRIENEELENERRNLDPYQDI